MTLDAAVVLPEWPSGEHFVRPLARGISRLNTASKAYAATLVGVATMGLALIIGGSLSHHSENERTVNAVVSTLQSRLPNLTSVSADSLRQDLRDWDEIANHHPLGDTLLRDVGIALLSAVVLAIVIEGYARNRLQDEIRSGVVEAAFKRLIPPVVFDQVKTHVMGATLIKDDWTIEMSLHYDPDVCDGNDHLLISTTVLKYTIRGVSERRVVSYPMDVALDRDHLHCSASGTRLPRFISVQVGSQVFEGDVLNRWVSADGSAFKAEYSISKPVEVTIVLEELLTIPDTFVWNTTLCTSSARLTINATAVPWVGLEVEANHPDSKALAPRVAGQSWELPVALLPYQGFSIRTFRKPNVSGPTPPQGMSLAKILTSEHGNLPQKTEGT